MDYRIDELCDKTIVVGDVAADKVADNIIESDSMVVKGPAVSSQQTSTTQIGATQVNESIDAIAGLNIVGRSVALQAALHCITVHGKYDAPVLITGETGTGKELAARGLHYGGARAAKPFVAVNCATLTSELFASEIFGHKKGAFTDARQDKKGLLAVAEKGTLFLDEIDSLSLNSQAALLRFLQESEYRPVGSEKTYRADVRLIASANCDLEERIDKGQFRRDLYYRLYILSVHMPPLRERQGDVAILVAHFLAQFNNQYRLGEKRMSAALLQQLSALAWPGNVRELENMVHRLYLSTASDLIDVEQLQGHPAMAAQSGALSGLLGSAGSATQVDSPVEPRAEAQSGMASISSNFIGDYSEGYDFSRDKRLAVEHFEVAYISKLLKFTEGNVTQAAMLCGKERRAFGKLVKKYDVKKTADVE